MAYFRSRRPHSLLNPLAHSTSPSSPDPNSLGNTPPRGPASRRTLSATRGRRRIGRIIARTPRALSSSRPENEGWRLLVPAAFSADLGDDGGDGDGDDEILPDYVPPPAQRPQNPWIADWPSVSGESSASASRDPVPNTTAAEDEEYDRLVSEHLSQIPQAVLPCAAATIPSYGEFEAHAAAVRSHTRKPKRARPHPAGQRITKEWLEGLDNEDCEWRFRYA